MNQAKARRDLVTNPAFDDLLRTVDEMARQESESLQRSAEESDLAKINVQAGVVEGIRRVLLRIENYKVDAITDYTTDTQRERVPEAA